ncbi:UNVERIFIED_CONTAM: UDP-glycosyltransferase 74E2 [Sesamum angustifolium]|uniref:UDP-glycosyltransferase 74E2 n=1 Tax=Sesamum angustifolium TaxID=2727405 RepID=A0AAW2MTK8_9LAMI
MRPDEMPSFIYDHGSCPGTFEMVLNQFRNVDKADWIFINTFDELEEEVLEWMSRSLRVKAIGPAIPSMYLDKRLQDDKEYEETSEKGLIVCGPQLDVLAHEAVACFITHCGWNSTLEGLSIGVPIVAMPQWTDQSTNAKFVTDVWGIGIRAHADEEELVRQEEIVRCLRNVMEGEEGKV